MSTNVPRWEGDPVVEKCDACHSIIEQGADESYCETCYKDYRAEIQELKALMKKLEKEKEELRQFYWVFDEPCANCGAKYWVCGKCHKEAGDV